MQDSLTVQPGSRDFGALGSFWRCVLLSILAYSRTPFVVTHTLMQNLPNQPTKAMGDRPDGLFET
jgi:hypothetical protein